MAATQRTTVMIPTSAGQIEAWLYRPQQAGPRPAVVLGCGVGAVKAAGLHPFAEAFCAAGCVAVAFDYLGFGGSEGTPRHVVAVEDEYRDYRNVVAWTREQQEVDTARVVAWGTSFGGMHVTRLLCEDGAVFAGIAQCPCVDALRASRMKPTWKSLRLSAYGIADLLGSYVGAEPLYVAAAATGAPGEEVALMDAPDVPAGWALLHKDIDRRGAPRDPHSNRIAARSVLTFPFARPALGADRITAPYLIVLPEKDTVAPADEAERVARRAAKGECVRVPGGHFDLYHGGIGFEQNLQAQLAFLRRLMPDELKSGGPARAQL